MIKFEEVDVYGFEAAIRGMRNPKNSWDKSDSCWCFDNNRNKSKCYAYCCDDCVTPFYEVGENDLKLMKSLSKAGSDHAKFLRMINITVDITAPLYWWKEFDTYKVGTVANSCSTMHKIHAKEFTLDDFSHEHLDNKMVLGLEANGERRDNDMSITAESAIEVIVSLLNVYRNEYIKTQDKHWWWQMIQLLPTSYNQKRTVQMNYEVLRHICNSRKGHKLDEWNAFIAWAEQLPYFIDICKPEEHICTCGGNCTCHKEGE